jgi:hypothetical protein
MISMSRALLVVPIAATLVAVSCRAGGSDPVPASLPGSYAYSAKGSTFKKPWEFSARLVLTPEKQFTLTLDKTIEGHRDPTETAKGTYAVSGDRLELQEGGGRLKSSKDLHKLVISADSLIAEVGWTVELFLKGVGAPNVVFVKEHRS